jgi:Spy/CpxP family protein refolding chaperone
VYFYTDLPPPHTWFTQAPYIRHWRGKPDMKRQLTRLAAVGAVAAGLIFAQAPVPAQAQTARPNQNKTATNHRAMARRHMFQALNLTPAQKQSGKAIFQQAREAARPVRDQLRQNREAMTSAVKANNKAQIEQLSAELGKLMGQQTTCTHRSDGQVLSRTDAPIARQSRPDSPASPSPYPGANAAASRLRLE